MRSVLGSIFAERKDFYFFSPIVLVTSKLEVLSRASPAEVLLGDFYGFLVA